MTARPTLPSRIQMLNIGLGAQAEASGGRYLTMDANLTAHLAGDTSGVFKRPHCVGLAVGAPRNGARYLYLATYGRSVWQARLA